MYPLLVLLYSFLNYLLQYPSILQRAEFKSWGVTADWEDPYLTMSPEYVKRQMR